MANSTATPRPDEVSSSSLCPELESISPYPKDYQCALKNVLSSEHLTQLLKKCPPLFLFGALKLPSVLKYVIDVEPDSDIVTNMTQATLLAHQLYLIEGTDIPVVIPTRQPDNAVDGVVVFGLEPEQRGWIHDFEHGSCTKLSMVQVEICLDDGTLCTLDAGAFVWADNAKDGLVKSAYRSWEIDTFLQTKLYKTMARERRSS
jgi:hypothetical protein